jgi:nucleoside-diphosphate-sugar epimerase
MSENAVTEHPSGIVMRLANVYGPRMSGSNVISEILRQIPNQGDILVADSTPVRDFVWVEDIVEGISKLALMDKAELGESKVYNLGTGVGTSISELAQLVLDLIGQPERRVVSKNPMGLASSIVLDYSSTTNACGWVPQTSLREGLRSLLFSSDRFKH